MSPTDTFWSNPRGTTPAGPPVLTHDSVGDQQDGPIDVATNGLKSHIPGTTAGAVPTAYTTSARAVYPWTLDFSAGSQELANYNDFVANKLDQFSSWHSLYQARYLAANNGFYAIPATYSRTTPDRNNPPDAAFMLASDGRTVINIMTIAVVDYMKLPLADRNKLENEAIWRNVQAPNLGLDLRPSSDVVSAMTGLTTAINNSAAHIDEADRKVFEKQLEIFQKRIDAYDRVATQTVLQELNQIKKRFELVLAFAKVEAQVGFREVEITETENQRRFIKLQVDVVGKAVSSDNGVTVNNGLTAFMRAEREILAALQRREAVSRITAVFDPKVDVANLIYQLQLHYQAEATARADAGTEEMSQLHRLLSDYAIMQRLVNETLKAFNPKETEEKRRFLNIGGKSDGGVDTDQQSGNQDTKIQYTWSDGYFYETDGNSNNQNGFQERPRYPWFLLQGTSSDHRIGDTRIRGNVNRVDDVLIVEGGVQLTAPSFYHQNPNNVTVLSGGLSAAEMRVVGMFSSDNWGSGLRGQLHPLETMYGVEKRPQAALSAEDEENDGSLRLERRDYWDKWATQLSDTVTILNQQNQMKQNEIENNTKEGNRHFDLGNNALRKMNEMLMSIGRM